MYAITNNSEQLDQNGWTWLSRVTHVVLGVTHARGLWRGASPGDMSAKFKLNKVP